MKFKLNTVYKMSKMLVTVFNSYSSLILLIYGMFTIHKYRRYRYNESDRFEKMFQTVKDVKCAKRGAAQDLDNVGYIFYFHHDKLF